VRAVKIIYHEHKLEWAYKSCWNTVSQLILRMFCLW